MNIFGQIHRQLSTQCNILPETSYQDETLDVFFYGNCHAFEHSFFDKFAQFSPSQTIASAYKEVGISLFTYVSYEFVAVIFCKKTLTIHIARDRFGILPLYFTYNTAHLFFTDSLENFYKNKLLSFQINESKLRNYLLPSAQKIEEHSVETIFTDVFSALPYHIISLPSTSQKIEFLSYWQPEKPLNFSETNYVSNFKEAFFKSVFVGIDGYKQPSGHLSGGLDSSSVCVVAASLLEKKQFSTFYIDTKPEIEERNYAEAVAEKIKSKHTNLLPKQHSYEAIKQVAQLTFLPEAFILPPTFHLAAAQKAAELGCDVVLTGHDGDSVAGHGLELIEELKKQKDWKTLKQQLENLAINYDLSHLETSWNKFSDEQKKRLYIQHFFTKEVLLLLKKKQFVQSISFIYSGIRRFNFSLKLFFVSLITKVFTKFKHNSIRLEKLIKVNEVVDYQSIVSFEASPEIEEQFKAATQPNFVRINEELYQIGKHFGHRYAFPFFEKKVLESSLFVPASFKFGNGKSRALLRKSVEEILPTEIQNRGDKTSFLAFSLKSFQELWLENKEVFLANEQLWNYVEKHLFLKNVEFLLDEKISMYAKSSVLNFSNRVLFLGIWLAVIQEKKAYSQ